MSRYFDFILSSIFPVADLVGGSTVEVGTGMERLMVMKRGEKDKNREKRKAREKERICKEREGRKSKEQDEYQSIPGAPLSFNVIE
jgi:hypothetical protein